MSWVRKATDTEIAQMRLIYAAVYMLVGIMPLDMNLDLSPPHEPSPEPDHLETEWTTPEVLRPPPHLLFPFRKRFQPIEKLVSAGQKQLRGIDTAKAREKFRWLCRDSSDKFVLRYIRQMGDSRKAVSAICETIVWHLSNLDGQEILRKGEAHSYFVEPNERFLRQVEVGKRLIVGQDRMGRPINVLVARRNFTRAQSTHDLETFSLLMFEQTFLSLQDSVDGAVIVFDMQGFSARNMDHKIARFIIDKVNKLYPMMVVSWYVYKAPRVFHGIYKVIKPLIDEGIASKIKFIDSNEELMAMIPVDQLPVSLGGNSRFEYRWIPPRREDDAPLRDDKTRRQLERERYQLFLQIESVTKQWITRTSPVEVAALEQERRFLFDKIRHNYWKLDPYVRSRTIYDRNGMFGMLRQELAEGGIAQPVCKAEMTYRDIGNTAPNEHSYTPSIMTEATGNTADRDTIPSPPSEYSLKGFQSPASPDGLVIEPQTPRSGMQEDRDTRFPSYASRKTVRMDAFRKSATTH